MQPIIATLSGACYNLFMKKKMIFILIFICLIVFSGALVVLHYTKKDATQTFADPIAVSTTLDTPIEGCLTLNVHSSLCIPTQLTKIGDDYFLVDCYHDQILTSTSLDTPLPEWAVLTDQIRWGHTIAGDGTVYLADDTENNRILIFEKKEDRFYMTQLFENIGVRPHFVVYDEDSSRFYALSSMTDEMYVFYREGTSNTVYLEKILAIPGLSNIYIRSFTIDGDEIFFVACNGQILRTSKKDLAVLETYPVPAQLAGMVQLTKIQNYYYLTVSTDLYGDASYATIVRAKSLADLSAGIYEDISHLFVGEGTPYYISYFNDAYYLTQHCVQPGTGVYQFQVVDDLLTDIVVLYP